MLGQRVTVGNCRALVVALATTLPVTWGHVMERLTALGFTSQEARVYVALLRQPFATGYELAKSTGLQRANVYQVLAALVDRSVAAKASEDSPARFVAPPPAEVLGRIKRQTAEHADSLIADLGGLA